jgi:hypothetical protein
MAKDQKYREHCWHFSLFEIRTTNEHTPSLRVNGQVCCWCAASREKVAMLKTLKGHGPHYKEIDHNACQYYDRLGRKAGYKPSKCIRC